MNAVSEISDAHLFSSITLKESFKQATEVEVRFVSVSQLLEPEKYRVIEQHKLTLIDQTLQILPIFFFITWAIAVLLFLRIAPNRPKKARYKMQEQIPCVNCRFLTNNPYLRCAVRPSTALTKQAIDCSDYQL